ncbi:MAG: hypothetical protein WCJ67_00965 [Thermoleophilia bacterium]
MAELELDGKSVLEPGCGLALPSFAAALAAARVLATDWAPKCLDLVAHTPVAALPAGQILGLRRQTRETGRSLQPEPG